MRKIIISWLIASSIFFLGFTDTTFWNASQWVRDEFKRDLIVENAGNKKASGKIKNVDSIFKTANSYVLYLYGIIAIGCFLYVWMMFLMALGKPEEFKKAWMAFMWVVLGLAAIPLSYVLVTIVAGVNLSKV